MPGRMSVLEEIRKAFLKLTKGHQNVSKFLRTESKDVDPPQLFPSLPSET